MNTESRAMRALERLTPGGSEFFNDPDRCAEWVSERRQAVTRQMMRAVRRRSAVLDAVEKLLESRTFKHARYDGNDRYEEVSTDRLNDLAALLADSKAGEA